MNKNVMSIQQAARWTTAVEEFGESVFQHLDLKPEALRPLLGFARERDYPPKTCLLSAGQQWDKLFYIHQGLVRLFYVDANGRAFNKTFFAEGACFWPVAPRDRNHPLLFHVAAIEAVVTVECSFPILHKFLSDHGCWERFALPFAEALVEQKFQREHDFLLLSATKRYEQFCRAHPNLVYRIPDYHLASFLGITNVSLSRIKRAAYG